MHHMKPCAVSYLMFTKGKPMAAGMPAMTFSESTLEHKLGSYEFFP